MSMDLRQRDAGDHPDGHPAAVCRSNGFLLLDDKAIVESTAAEDDARRGESAVYARIFDGLMAEAVTGDEARRLIAAAAADLREKG